MAAEGKSILLWCMLHIVLIYGNAGLVWPGCAIPVFWVTFNPAGVQGSYHKLVQNWSHVAFGPVLLFAFCPVKKKCQPEL